VTGASQGIGAGNVLGFVERGFAAEDWLVPGQSRNACLIKFVGGSTPDRSKLFEVVIRWLSLLSPTCTRHWLLPGYRAHVVVRWIARRLARVGPTTRMALA
jgi:hypothetical protein